MKVIQLERFRRGEDEHVMLPYEAGSACDCITAMLPGLEKRSYLDTDTCGGYTDIYIDGECIDTANGARRKLVSIPAGKGREVKLRFIEAGTAARLIRAFTTSSPAYILPYGLYAAAVEYDGKQAVIGVTADIENDGGAYPCELEITIYNKRGKRVSSRKKKLNLKTGQKTVKLNLKIRSVNAYSQSDPYMYTVGAKLTGGAGTDESDAVFAVRNDEAEPLSGAFISSVAGCFGGISTTETETYKLKALAAQGYNTVRVSGCPTDAALTAMDNMGFKCIVDLFDNWSQPRGATLAHVDFRVRRACIIRSAVRALRSHPCVIMYSVGNAPEESYGRVNPSVLDEIITIIRQEDDSRYITAALAELVPTPSELEYNGVPAAEITNAGTNEAKLLQLGRNCDLFNIATEAFALQLDIVGLSAVSAEGAGSGRPVFFAATPPEKAYDFYAEFDRADDILGDISDCGIAAGRGDLDEIYQPDVTGEYRRTVKGISGAFIAAGGSDPMLAKRHWNFAEGSGKTNIFVYTSADVVALYLNGRLIGRKLAGKINNYIATFETEYRHGNLEAVCYLGGKEVERCSLSSAGKPRAIKLTAPRTVAADGTAIVGISVVDADGNLTAAQNPVSVAAEGAEVLFTGNGEGIKQQGSECEAASGRAMTVLRASKGAEKIVITVTGGGLRKGRATIKIK